MDQFAGAALEIQAEEEHRISNRKTRGSDKDMNRGVIQLVSETPTIRIRGIFLLIPSQPQVQFRSDIRELIKASIIDATMDHPNIEDISSATHQALELTEYRISYIGVVGALDEEFGGRFRQVHPIAITISTPMAKLVHAMTLVNLNTKIYRLQSINVGRLPQ